MRLSDINSFSAFYSSHPPMSPIVEKQPPCPHVRQQKRSQLDAWDPGSADSHPVFGMSTSKNKMKPTNPNAHTYDNDPETRVMREGKKV